MAAWAIDARTLAKSAISDPCCGVPKKKIADTDVRIFSNLGFILASISACKVELPC